MSNSEKVVNRLSVDGIMMIVLGVILVATTVVGCDGEKNQQLENNNDNGEIIEESDTDIYLDTRVDIMVEAYDREEANAAIEAAQSEIERLENIMSRHIEGSEIDEINQQAGEEPVEVSDETWDVLEKSIELSDLMDGYFDITIAPIMDLWGYGNGDHQVPDEVELEEQLEYVDYAEIEMDEENQTVYLPYAQMSLDLGGAAKGYIVDRAADVLQEYEIESGLVDAGDIRTTGYKHNGDPWRIGVTHPRDRQNYFAVIELGGEAVDTSGDYERYFKEDGERYHHIIDPYTGYPTEDLISVSVVTDTAFKSDILSTGAFGLGWDDSIDLFEELEDVEAVLVNPKGEYYITSGLEEDIELVEPHHEGQLQ